MPFEDRSERSRRFVIGALHLLGVKPTLRPNGLISLQQPQDFVPKCWLRWGVGSKSILSFRLPQSGFGEDDGVRGQFAAHGSFSHPLHEPGAEVWRLSQHIHQHESIGACIANLGHRRDALSFEDGFGLRQRLRLFGVIIGRQKRRYYFRDPLSQGRIPAA